MIEYNLIEEKGNESVKQRGIKIIANKTKNGETSMSKDENIKEGGAKLVNLKMNKSVFPNTLTLFNLFLGLLSLVFTMEGKFSESAIMILLAMVMDGMDGKLARRLDASTNLGKELDSLSDLVSFGVAPSLLLYASITKSFGKIGLLITIVFALCGAFRLARFNVMNITNYFVGIPITMAGSLLAIFVLLQKHLPTQFYPMVTLVLAYLMVSNIKVKKY